uniref:B box-type domain-containing protein n=2 Tax=Macrostomum lignano TaxID=282301 RepID=A0A1I8FRV6_9PLAT
MHFFKDGRGRCAECSQDANVYCPQCADYFCSVCVDTRHLGLVHTILKDGTPLNQAVTLACGCSDEAVFGDVQIVDAYGASIRIFQRDLYYDLKRYNTIGYFRQFMSSIVKFPTSCAMCTTGDLGPILHGDALMGWKHRASVAPGLASVPIGDLPFPFAHVDVASENIAPASGACPNWTAGETSRITTSSRKLDVTGFFIVACRHGFIWACSDVRTPGEQLVYPVKLLKAAVQRIGVPEEAVTFVYDVACKLGNKVTSKLAVPVFHAYGHESKCRLNNSIRVVSGTGITDGEICERIFSFLRPFGRILKEMRIDRRTRLVSHIINMYHLRLNPDAWIKSRQKLLEKKDQLVIQHVNEINRLQPRHGIHQYRLLLRKAKKLALEMNQLRSLNGNQYSIATLRDTTSEAYSRLDRHVSRRFPIPVQLLVIEVYILSIRSTEERRRVNAEQSSLMTKTESVCDFPEYFSESSSSFSGVSDSEDE